jgi:hypothetical protein
MTIAIDGLPVTLKEGKNLMSLKDFKSINQSASISFFLNYFRGSEEFMAKITVANIEHRLRQTLNKEVCFEPPLNCNCIIANKSQPMLFELMENNKIRVTIMRLNQPYS